MPTPKFQPYAPGLYDDTDKKIKGLGNAYVETTQYLQWMLSHLDEKNVVRAKAVVTDWVYAGNVTTDQLTAGTAKISTALIESLVVGSNVTMGPNVYISWNNVTDQPAPYTDAQALAAWVASGYKTYIDENGVYTGALTANQITTGTLSSVTIDVTTDLNVGNNIYLYRGGFDDKSIYFSDNTYLQETYLDYFVLQSARDLILKTYTNYNHILLQISTDVMVDVTPTGVQLNGKLAFFGGDPVIKTTVSDPSSIGTGSSPSTWTQSWGSNVKTDLDNLRSTLNNLINALQSYGMV